MAESTRRAETDKQQQTCQELLTHRVEKDVKESFKDVVELPKLRIEWGQINMNMKMIFGFIFGVLVLLGGVGWQAASAISDALRIEHDYHFIDLERRVDELEAFRKDNKEEDAIARIESEANSQNMIDHEGNDSRNFNAIKKHIQRKDESFELPHE